MNYEYEINQLKNKVANLTEAFLNAQRNQVPVTAKVDDTANKVVEITPYTQTKTAYFNETEKTYYGVPVGNISVFFDNYNGEWSVDRISDRVTVRFDRLNAQTNITLSIN